jgi:hypothetical protein
LGKRFALFALLTACLWVPEPAHANGDPASDYLLTQSVFLPFTTKIDRNEVKKLDVLLREAGQKKFRIRVAMILAPSDLGTAFSLFQKPEKYARFLGLELSFVYRGRLLVVMPNGYGYSVNGDPDPKASAPLKGLPPPGRDATKEVQGAILAVQRLAAADGHRLATPKVGGSTGRDRLTIAAAATAGIALIAAFVVYRRRRSSAGN